ncbi:MAG: TIGR01841 family phasin [Caulobacteraceae bacterium]|nr:TIGR01841 family phasin [Caulobacteraceae bacterium]
MADSAETTFTTQADTPLGVADRVKTASQDFARNGAAAFKDQVEKSMAAVSELNVHSKKNLEAVVASVTAAAKGAETLGARAIAFSKKSLEDQVAAAKTLGGAKSVQEVVELQSAFARSAFDAYVAELNGMAETVSASMKEALAPINERVTAMVERVKAQH